MSEMGLEQEKEKITQEQAVKIFKEFFKFKETGVPANLVWDRGLIGALYNVNHISFGGEVKWLYSPEGQEAAMDKLWEERILCKYWHSGQDGSVMSCQLNNNGWREPRVNITSKFCNSTKHALLLAVLAMIKEKSCGK